MTLILVVDDVRPLAEQYAYDLKRLGGYDTLIADGGRAALDLLTQEPVDCVILDLEMPDLDGFDVLRGMDERKLRIPVIVYTGTGNYDRCVRAVQLGAYGFIDKGEPMERVAQEVARAVERERLTGEVAALRRRLDADSPLLGSSPAMERLRELIGKLAPVPSPVLIVGESGSGKELVARELHRLGKYSKGPFVAINSAALPEHLVESELFGHERGAFTGAATLRRGAFEAASGGTLFLDEVGELPLAAQAKLLRVLEQREVTRVGGTRTIAVDVRVVAATNRDLDAEVVAKRFREDLLYRLNVHVLPVPPLRDHRSDIPELADRLLAVTCERFGLRRRRLHDGAVRALMAHDWHRNNVRELRNVIERLVIESEGDVIGVEDVPPEIGGTADPATGSASRTYHERKVEAERQIVVEALERNNWHITRTAHELGLADHASLLKIMRRLKLSRD
ncbi:MAG: sigma-54 dependent transcriptional regulator [Gemmatimonadota bacterium]|nr:sigma-54 dependent transcriptional regulator [Gemmatimonadota bacterium]